MTYARPHLLRFRALQRRLFDSTVEIVRPTGEQTEDPGGEVTTVGSPVYTGDAQLLKPEAVFREDSPGAVPTVISSYQATVPHHVEVLVDDLLTVTASFDAALVGRTFRVREVRRSEWLVHRKMLLEEPQ